VCYNDMCVFLPADMESTMPPRPRAIYILKYQ
jgi:hypothetical protein